MGLGSLPTRTDMTTIVASWWNVFKTALCVDLVPRNSSGDVANIAGSLGTTDWQWKNLFVKNIFLDSTALDPTQFVARSHRISSAKAKTSGYPNFLTPAGSTHGLSATLAAASTNFRAVVNGTSVTLTGDLLFSSLSAAPSSNNTCLVNDANMAGQSWTTLLGEHGGTYIPIDTVGTGITALNGRVAAFKKGTEIFLARVDTTGGKLWPMFRGWAGSDRAALTDNDTLTLMALNTLLLNKDGITKVATSYFPESVGVAPAAGTAGKVYFERSTGKHAYDDGTQISYDYLIVGWAVSDTTDCQWAQPYDIDVSWRGDIDVRFRVKDTTTVSVLAGSSASVYGFDYGFSADVDMTQAGNMDSGEAIAASTTFFLYMKQDGGLVFSTVAPRPFSFLTKGCYHPKEYYRCIGAVSTSTTSTFMYELAAVADSSWRESDALITTGASDKTICLPSAKLHRGRTIFIKKVDSGAGIVIVNTLSGETMDGDTTLNLRSRYDFLAVVSDGSTWLVKSYLNRLAWTTTIIDLDSAPVDATFYLTRRENRNVEVALTATLAGSKTNTNPPTVSTVPPTDFQHSGVGRRIFLGVSNPSLAVGYLTINPLTNGWSFNLVSGTTWASAVTTQLRTFSGSYLLDN